MYINELANSLDYQLWGSGCVHPNGIKGVWLPRLPHPACPTPNGIPRMPRSSTVFGDGLGEAERNIRRGPVVAAKSGEAPPWADSIDSIDAYGKICRKPLLSSPKLWLSCRLSVDLKQPVCAFDHTPLRQKRKTACSMPTKPTICCCSLEFAWK